MFTNFDSNAEIVNFSADNSSRQIQELAGLYRMATLLMAERCPAKGLILVHGSRGGLELKALAEARPGWSFDGVDPSDRTLSLARQTVGSNSARVRLHQGEIDVAPDGPFDAAASLLTFNLIPREQRKATLRQIRWRMRQGAPFVLAHMSLPQREPERSRWIARHVAFFAADGTSPAQLEKARQAIAAELAILPPEEEELMLHAAGFSNVRLFYASLGYRGWVSYAE